VRITDARFLRRFALLNAVVPGAILAYDAARGHLGANGVNHAIHTTGLLALIFFVLSLAITPLKRVARWNELVAARRILGLCGFSYLVVHFGIFFFFDRGGSVSSTLHEIITRRYLTIGTCALAMFVPLAVTSTDGMISRLGPKRWKRLHRLTYVATSLGAIHYILLVKSDIRQPVVFASLIGVLLVARTIAGKKRPKPSIWSGEVSLSAVTDETHDVKTFRFAPAPFTAEPGQYLNIALAIEGARVNRSYTIAAVKPDYLEITVKNCGFASKHLHSLAVGTTVKISGPAGHFVFAGAGDRVVFIAGGVGITPIMAMIRGLVDRRWPGRIDLVYSVKTSADVVFGKELEELAKRMPALRMLIVKTRETGHVTKALMPDVRDVPIYLCGPDPMMQAMKSLLAELGAQGENIHLEAFVSPPRLDAPQTEMAIVPGDPGMVQFARSGEVAEASGTLLEAAEELGLEIPFDCRSGICGQCKTPLLSGRVVMEVQDALTAEDRKRRLVLACQARPIGSVIVDA
jgi:ferredoxin-NADP reductase/DMSO/TMAO reductase YedYZ heme-binding membrane subunit